MLVRCMGPYLIDYDLKAKRMRARNQRIELCHGAKHGINGVVVTHVIPKIALGRGEKRREPNAVNAQPRDVIELGGHTPQVSNPIAIGIGKAARVDLIEGRPAPPVRIRRLRRQVDISSTSPYPLRATALG